MPFGHSALKVLEARYLRVDPHTAARETPDEMLNRVAGAVAEAERDSGGAAAVRHWRQTFFDVMERLDFLPNSPTLMNAGTPLGQLSACFVLPIDDSMQAIFEALRLMALVQQSGGGTGFSFSRLRPAGDVVASTGGSASGPVSFMRIFDCATENIRQGGKRRGANMGILRCDHPDIMRFVEAKLDGESFQNFNLSVAVTDSFMQAAESGQTVALRNPRSGEPCGNIAADELLRRIAEAAWRTGDPGLVFLDAIARENPTPALGEIEATNPCGEVPLLPYESCNLGSINLSHMVRESGDGATVDWDRLAEVTQLAIRFLDDVIEVSRWPVSEIAAMTRGNRKVGLGVMGFADMLIKLGVPYASDGACSLAEKLMEAISREALAASVELAGERGVFPNWEQSVYAKRGQRVRNATRTSIAPTGTIGILAGTSAGIEPLFALAYRRHALDGQTLSELNPLVLSFAKKHGFYSESLVHEVMKRGSLADISGVPDQARELFATALEIAPENHLRIQVAFQKHTDNAVSKTINLPAEAEPDVVADIYRRAWQSGLKGITIFRYGSKGQQVLELGVGELPLEREYFTRCDPEACKV